MIATAVLVADVASTLDLSDRSEVRARSTLQTSANGAPATSAPGAPQLGVDVVTTPEARLHTSDRRWDLNVGYSAGLIAPDVEQGFTPQVLQTGSVAVSWHDRTIRWMVGQDGTYGVENSAYLLPTTPAAPTAPGQPPATVSTAPRPGTITFGYSRSYVSVAVHLDRRTNVSAGVEYLVSGGLDATSQQQLPEQTGPRATAELDYALSRTDSLATLASGQQADFSAAPCAAGATSGTCELSDRIAQATERLRHALSRSMTASLSAGVALTSVRFHSSDAYGDTFFPVVEAGLTDSFGTRGRSSIDLFVRLAPFMDVHTGIVLQSLQGTATLREWLTRHVTLHAATGATQELPTSDPAATFIVYGDVGFDYHVDPSHEGPAGAAGAGAPGPIDLSMGERWFLQSENGLGAFVSSFGYIAVTVRERTLHF